MHIVFLPRWYPNRYDPMPGLFIRRHAEAASVHCVISVVYVHAAGDDCKGYEIAETSEPNLYTVTVYYPGSKYKVLSMWRFLRSNFMGIKRISRCNGLPDIVHVHVLTRLALVAWWLKLRFGIPYLVTEHWSRYIDSRKEFKGFARKCLTRFLVRRAAMVTTVTRNLAVAMRGHGLANHNYRILPNVVDTAMFKPAFPKLNKPKRMIHISCFEDRSKNISGLLRTLYQLSLTRTDFECVMVGDGADFAPMKALAGVLGLEHLVRFTGLLQGKELAATLASADFLVLFSNYENLPVVIPEAMACGLPVVATKVGGIAEIVNEHNGLLIEPRDEAKLNIALSWMLDNVDKFEPEVLRKPVVENNSPEAVGLLLHEWYSEVKNKS
jgi:glycosyltransferase involved in cell wall biosynthesis